MPYKNVLDNLERERGISQNIKNADTRYEIITIQNSLIQYISERKEEYSENGFTLQAEPFSLSAQSNPKNLNRYVCEP